jgi:hypothetical protein
MIKGELTWQQFKTLDSIRNLNESKQIQHYYEYLTWLGNQYNHQNKGALPVTEEVGPALTTSSVLFNSPQGQVYFYDSSTNISTKLNVPSTSSAYSSDIAHTQNKLWINSFSTIREWDITLNPFTATLNRTITLPHSIGAGLGAIDDTTLIATNTSVSPNTVVTLDITSNSPTSTYKFDLAVSGSGRVIAGDLLLTTTNKVITTNYASGVTYATQFNYATGTVEVDTNIGGIIGGPFGLYIENNNIYIMNSDGGVYQIDKTSPYNITLTGSTGVTVFGASQVPSALTTNFT